MELTGHAEQPEIWIRTVFLRNSLSCSDDQLRQLGRYVSLLLKWNREINLISRRDEENVWGSHVLHSLSLLFKYAVPDGARILDLGTGGGLPGIPLKILLPTVSMMMVDSTKKKVDAVKSMIMELQLSQAEATWGRAEALGRETEHTGSFDYVLARGVAPLHELVHLSVPFLKLRSEGLDEEPPPARKKKLIPRKSLVAYKGGPVEEEIGKIEESKLVRAVHVSDLAFQGSERMMLAEKKLIVVEFRQT
ncbi:MAG: 16S rRNA (guanine(527)-N(7))-methyltransferase RsmG [Ignavibacteriales bacterium]|nr:16S rRNA (guanine(527)-N(7))-methyltransferase RsmG [Ignavibacteriales bacterium]